MNPLKSALSAAALFSILTLPLSYVPTANSQEAGPGEGLVILTREDKMKGKAMRFNMDINGRQMQLLAGNTLRVPLPVGTHSLSVWSPSLDGQDSVTIDVKEGWTYHIEGYIRWGWPAGRTKFRFVSESGPEPGSVASQDRNITDQGDSGGAPLAGASLGAAATSSTSPPSRTPDEAGRIGLRNFVGDWDLEMWSLAADGSKLEGRGIAQGVAEGDSARITFTEFSAPGSPNFRRPHSRLQRAAARFALPTRKAKVLRSRAGSSTRSFTCLEVVGKLRRACRARPHASKFARLISLPG
jgi:hypothetical protein